MPCPTPMHRLATPRPPPRRARKIAELATEIEAARPLTYRSAWLADRGRYTKEWVPFLSMAKYYASELAVKVSGPAAR